MMTQKSYTFVVVADDTLWSRQIQLTHSRLRLAIISGTLAFISIAYLFYHYMILQVNPHEIERLRQTVNVQQGVAARLETLSEEVARLRGVDIRIRGMVGVETAPTTESAIGVGGGTEELEQALTVEELAAQQRLMGQLYEDLERLEREIALRAESLEALTSYLTDQKDRLAATPSIWPTKGYVSSKFGPRNSPFTGRLQHHMGVDIAAALGTPIVAPADGVVTFAGKMAGYGRAIVINHGFGFKTFYAHNQDNKVTKGERVKRGQVIGRVGSSGYSTGSHLHYEVLVKESPVNPLKYILNEERRPNI